MRAGRRSAEADGCAVARRVDLGVRLHDHLVELLHSFVTDALADFVEVGDVEGQLGTLILKPSHEIVP